MPVMPALVSIAFNVLRVLAIAASYRHGLPADGATAVAGISFFHDSTRIFFLH